MSSSARRTAGPCGALRAVSTRQTGRTTAASWVDVCAKWTIFVLGMIITSYRKASTQLTECRVGGVVSETSFKFFIQFVAYTSIFCTFALIVCAYFTAEIRRQVRLPRASHHTNLQEPVTDIITRPEE